MGDRAGTDHPPIHQPGLSQGGERAQLVVKGLICRCKGKGRVTRERGRERGPIGTLL